MSWAKADDRYDDTPKIKRAWRLSGYAVGLHWMAVTSCARHESDGLIDPEWLAERLAVIPRKAAVAALKTLVSVGLFEELPAGETRSTTDEDGNLVTVGPLPENAYIVHDYLDYNPSSAQSGVRREWDRRRKELQRDPELIAAIRARDKDRCRYCGAKVNWRDRRGETGATYDHVIPRGPNTLANVVVACRGCNMRKGGRTPGEAKMPLLDATDLGTGQVVSSPSPNHQLNRAADDQVNPTRPDPTRPDPNKEPPLAPPASAGGEPGHSRTAPPRKGLRANRQNPRAVAEQQAAASAADRSTVAVAALSELDSADRERWERLHPSLMAAVDGNGGMAVYVSDLYPAAVDGSVLVLDAPAGSWASLRSRCGKLLPACCANVGVEARLATDDEHTGFQTAEAIRALLIGGEAA
jgi:5-methylcytosine-specific restriction endonuclease McrA